MKLLFLLVFSTIGTVSISAQVGGIKYENRTDLLNANDCKASEAYLKKKVKAQVASFYTDYPYISVDFTMFKGQHGYSPADNPKKFIYPYKIEMLVYLKRKITKEGKELTECVTWKYDAVYEYATLPGKKCEFYIVPSSQITRISHREF